MTTPITTSTTYIETLYRRQCADGYEDRPVDLPARQDVPAELYAAELTDDRCGPTVLYRILDVRVGNVWLEMDDNRQWELTINGGDVTVDTATLRDLVRVLQRPEVRAALLLAE